MYKLFILLFNKELSAMPLTLIFTFRLLHLLHLISKVAHIPPAVSVHPHSRDTTNNFVDSGSYARAICCDCVQYLE
jgi:hypothetical protein